MKHPYHVFDRDGIQIQDPDLSKGRLEMKKRKVFHEKVEPVEESGHYEVVEVFPLTGGKTVEWVIDVPGCAGHEAYEEEVPYLEYVLYTAEDREKIQASQKEHGESKAVAELRAENAEIKKQLSGLIDALNRYFEMTAEGDHSSAFHFRGGFDG